MCPPANPADDSNDTASTPSEPENDDEQHDENDEGNDDATTKGHGRIPAQAYPDARHVAVPHEELHAGGTCPCCTRGKLFEMSEPSRIVRIFGQSPLAAVEWDCQRLRCGGCGGVFTAKAPEEAQGPKYDDTAASMMALMRYGTGMPLNRFAHLGSAAAAPVQRASAKAPCRS